MIFRFNLINKHDELAENLSFYLTLCDRVDVVIGLENSFELTNPFPLGRDRWREQSNSFLIKSNFLKMNESQRLCFKLRIDVI